MIMSSAQEKCAGPLRMTNPFCFVLVVWRTQAPSRAVCGASPQSWSRSEEDHDAPIDPSSVGRGTERTTRGACDPQENRPPVRHRHVPAYYGALTGGYNVQFSVTQLR